MAAIGTVGALVWNASLAAAPLGGLGFAGLCPMNYSGEPCPDDYRHVAYPLLPELEVSITVVFSCRHGAPPRSAIYVFSAGAWQLVHRGGFVRGSLLSGRGGKGNGYRLVDGFGRAATLSGGKGALVLTDGGSSMRLFYRPER